MGTINRPIRILELRSVRGTGGGPEKTILFGAARADPARYAVTVCYIRDQRDDVFHIDQRAGSLPIDYVEVRERHSFDPSIWKALRDLVRRRHIDIVHAHDYKTDLLAWALGWAEPAIPMSTAHGWAGHTPRLKWCYYPADRRVLARLPRVIAVSSDIRDALVEVGTGRSRVEVIPNGIDDRRFRRDTTLVGMARATCGIQPDDIVLGAVGRLELEKNYTLLLRAFHRLSKEHPRVRLLIAGDGSLRTELDRMIGELGLGARCSLLGEVADVAGLHHALDAFVMCSDNEGSPNAVLEAMALETPVVCTDVGGVTDLVRNGIDGLLVPRRNVDALTEALRTAVGNPTARDAWRRAARARVEQEFSFEKRMNRVETVYLELMEAYPWVRDGRRWYKGPSHA